MYQSCAQRLLCMRLTVFDCRMTLTIAHIITSNVHASCMDSGHSISTKTVPYAADKSQDYLPGAIDLDSYPHGQVNQTVTPALF